MDPADKALVWLFAIIFVSVASCTAVGEYSSAKYGNCKASQVE